MTYDNAKYLADRELLAQEAVMDLAGGTTPVQVDLVLRDGSRRILIIPRCRARVLQLDLAAGNGDVARARFYDLDGRR